MRRSVLVLVAVLSLGLAACGGDEGSPPDATGGEGDCVDLTAGDTFSIEMSDFEFHPDCFTARAAQSISITNTDSADHTFTIQGTQIDVTVSGGSGFNGEPVTGVVEPGTYDFVCRFHPAMTGTVTIT